MPASRPCLVCGASYEGAYRPHLDAAGHARSRPGRPPHADFLREVAEHPDRRIPDIGADHGLRLEAARRAAARAGLFRRGRREATLARDRQIVRRAADGVTRRRLAEEFGLSLANVYYVLRLARHDAGTGQGAGHR